MADLRPEWRLAAEARAAQIGLVLPRWYSDACIREIEAKETVAIVATPRLSGVLARGFDDIKRELRGNRFWGVKDYSKRWRSSLPSASKVVSALEVQGLIRCEHQGRHKLIVWADGVETVARAA